MEVVNKMQNGYYVYRFKNEDGIIIYVGKTVNLENRFKNHEHMTEDVKIIEYIECASEADMAWKEIYYINLYYNELSMNVTDVYLNGNVTDMCLNDKWKLYTCTIEKNDLNDEIIMENYNKYVLNLPNYDYKSLINILEHDKLNSIGDGQFDLSQHWFEMQYNNGTIKKLKNNMVNFFNNIIKGKSFDNMWTTYWLYRDTLKAKGYAKGFISVQHDNIKCIKRHNLAYLKNNFYSLEQSKNITVNQDIYALSDMMRFIFKSAISVGEPINIYIPSRRMRQLLKKWINDQKYEDKTNESN